MLRPTLIATCLLFLNLPAAIGNTTYEAPVATTQDRGPSFRLECVPNRSKNIRELVDDCKILKFYNQSEVDLMGAEQSIRLANYCACQLVYLTELWEESFDRDSKTRRLWSMVSSKLEHDSKEQTNASHSSYLWTDIDVTIYKISIYTATKDYFDLLAQDSLVTRIEPKIKAELDKKPAWKLVRYVCRNVARDPHKLYQYSENLARLNPLIFLELIELSQPIEMIYQASKACKLLVYEHLHDFKLRPESLDFVPVAGYAVDYEQMAAQTMANSRLASSADHENQLLGGGDLDSALRDAAAFMVTKCATSSRPKLVSLQQLTKECPMMIEDKVPQTWLEQFRSPIQRTRLTINCGCQLLLHNSTWDVLIQDSNVKTMSEALTNYMNLNRVPDFANTPIWTLYGWFNDIMSVFVSSRRMLVKQVIMTVNGNQDPLKPTNHGDHERALELLRRGCNLIRFNYNKDPNFKAEVKLINYLDRLQMISQDPMFIFHLTLQNANLFKLYALSKMCEPIIK